VLAYFILKKLNKDDLNQDLMFVFNNIVNLYNVAFNAEIRLKAITTENVCKLYNIDTLKIYVHLLRFNDLLNALHRICHLNIIVDIKNCMYKTMIDILNPEDNLYWYTNINEQINKFQIYYNKIINDNYKNTQTNTDQYIVLQTHNDKHENNHDTETVSTASSITNNEIKLPVLIHLENQITGKYKRKKQKK